MARIEGAFECASFGPFAYSRIEFADGYGRNVNARKLRANELDGFRSTSQKVDENVCINETIALHRRFRDIFDGSGLASHSRRSICVSGRSSRSFHKPAAAMRSLSFRCSSADSRYRSNASLMSSLSFFPVRAANSCSTSNCSSEILICFRGMGNSLSCGFRSMFHLHCSTDESPSTSLVYSFSHSSRSRGWRPRSRRRGRRDGTRRRRGGVRAGRGRCGGGCRFPCRG